MSARKPDPIKHCKQCGALMGRKRYSPSGLLESVPQFLKRQFCGIECQIASTADSTNRQTMHYRARRCRGGACERCGSVDRLEVHHRDGDRTNNDPANLETLCGRCHRQHHARRRRGRLAT